MKAAMPPDTNGIATRESWKVLDPPEMRVALEFSESYTHSDFGQIKRGVIPEEMEDKWFIFFEEPWLYFHRSWTGEGIYGVKFQRSNDGASVVASWVGQSDGQYMKSRRDYHRAMLKFLIDALLLGKAASFPIPNDLPQKVPKGLYQHHVAGRGYPEVVFPASQAPSLTWWVRLLRFFRRPGTDSR
jgi:hypothetical protein